MAQLKGTRMTDSTLVSSVDDNMREFEQAIADIIGIPVNTEIAASILGQVLNTGECRGVLKMEGSGGGATSGGGIQIKNTAASPERIFRIIATGDELMLYEYNVSPDYVDAWKPIQDLSTPVTSLEQLDEFSLITPLDADDDEKVLQIDASDPDNIKIQLLSVTAAGGVAWPDLSDVADTFYEDYDDGDVLVMQKDPRAIIAMSPDIVASDVQVLGDLDDVEPAAIVQPDDAGKIFGVHWDGVTEKAEWQRHILGRANFNMNDDALPAGGGAPAVGGGTPYPITSVAYSGAWTRIRWNSVGFLAEGDGLGDAGMAEIGDDYITLPEPGPYLINVWMTWQYWHQNPTQTQEGDESPNYIRSKISANTGSSLGLASADELMHPFYHHHYIYPGSAPEAPMLEFQTPPNLQVQYQFTGFWYALEADATISLLCQQNSGQDRYVKFATVFAAKVR